MPKLFLHHIDVVNDRYVSGWCFNRLLPNKAVTLKVYANGKILGKVRCELPRKDVAEAGLNKTGNCGFVCHFPEGALQSNTALTFSISGWPKSIITIRPDQIQPVLTNTPPLFFMHIPKTAGTSFNNHVQSWFDHGDWHIHTETYDKEKILSLANPGVYLAGHLRLFEIKSLFPDLSTINLLALLRDPLKQLHSHLAWIKGIGLNQDGSFYHSHPQAIQDLALKMQHHEFRTPDQLSMFVGQLNGFEWDFFDNIQTRYFLNDRPDQVTAGHVDQAIGNLDLYSSVGLTEEYELFIKTVADQHGRKHQRQSSKHNKTKVTPLFDLESIEVQEALQPLVQYDQLLYNAVATSIGR